MYDIVSDSFHGSIIIFDQYLFDRIDDRTDGIGGMKFDNVVK